MGTHQPIRKTVTPEIPDKLYFRIGDVARLCEVPAYVLRFWETEFPQLRPNKGGTGQRLYRKRDVEMALRIKSLLYDQGYTIPGARQVFKNEAKPKEAGSEDPGESAVHAVEPTLGERSTPMLAATPAAQDEDPGAVLRRQAKLRHLREDMHALLAVLAKPVGAAAANELKVQALRPRLVLEPRQPSSHVAERRQGDLFAIE